ncbi:hypothetical protein OH76DRAFT_1004927 [Lentinus brumalis]|uniref:Uncharacterized protein n=1 Tax=Lentinus brumalis TaxID=2498619 RepID=A0A371CYN2_9APHY|nr:hypothetical protein OH76DRAFT_1004927 [Polyporus brumalis]
MSSATSNVATDIRPHGDQEGIFIMRTAAKERQLGQERTSKAPAAGRAPVASCSDWPAVSGRQEGCMSRLYAECGDGQRAKERSPRATEHGRRLQANSRADTRAEDEDQRRDEVAGSRDCRFSQRPRPRRDLPFSLLSGSRG